MYIDIDIDIEDTLKIWFGTTNSFKIQYYYVYGRDTERDKQIKIKKMLSLSFRI